MGDGVVIYGVPLTAKMNKVKLAGFTCQNEMHHA